MEAKSEKQSDQLTLFAAGSPAKTLAPPEGEQASRTEQEAGYGRSTPVLLASYDHDTSLWRTSQLCLDGELTVFSETFPRSGTMRNGIAYQLPPLVPLTAGIGSGLLPTPEASNTKAVALRSGGRSPRDFLRPWRTPRANDGEKRGNIANDPRNGLPAAVKYWPTPHANCHTGAGQAPNKQGGENLQTQAGGSLNPTWVEWLQGFPLGWTEVE